MDYTIERDNTQDPSLPEMTKAALEILQRDAGGYFLLVEGGLIDLGHHGNKGKKALTETLEMDEAVKVRYPRAVVSLSLSLSLSLHTHSSVKDIGFVL
ncbi:Alkaline phosphatase, placental type [Portunus trituberculatus]|uniref:alkaline phosphatase n=1 Tax=Portunus trituberculatus TaxID=210409 RepID=A0A5B7JZ88_PORTR|nr:Alkaline phosphatase, placental type [Portunus trituberculatus]